jgi:hypothetical protein
MKKTKISDFPTWRSIGVGIGSVSRSALKMEYSIWIRMGIITMLIHKTELKQEEFALATGPCSAHSQNVFSVLVLKIITERLL